MSECERCQERLVDRLSGDLDLSDLPLVTDHLIDCEVCQEVDARLRVGMGFAARLVVEEPPEAVTKALMKAAREQCGDDAAATTFSTALLSVSRPGLLGRVRTAVTRPQFVMGIVMLLAVVFGAWYVPRRVEISRIGSGASTFVPSELDPAPAAELGAGVPAASLEARLERGLQAFGRSDYVGAIDELNAVASAPEVSDDAWTTATHHLARSYTRHGDCESATRRYEQLFGRNPTYNQTHLAMVEAGACYRELGNEPRARELLDVAIRDPATATSARAELELLRTPTPGRRRPNNEPPRRGDGTRSGAGTAVSDP